MKLVRLFLISSFLIMSACQTSIKRDVASVATRYSSTPPLLKPIGEFGILFNLERNIFYDGNFRELGTCRVDDPPAWANKLEDYLATLSTPSSDGVSYFKKFHVIELKRGDIAAAQINKTEDDVSILSITYIKKQTFPRGAQADFKRAEMNCEHGKSDNLLRENIFEWPDSYEVISALKVAPLRSESRAFPNIEFIRYLASKNVLIQIDLDQFKNNKQTFWSLGVPFQLWSEEISTSKKKFESIDYWIKTISQKSRAAQKFQLLNITLGSQQKYGIEVDQLVNKFSSRQSNQYDPTRILIGGVVNESQLDTPRLGELDQCLAAFKGVFLRQPAESKENLYSIKPETFLSPGHLCEAQ